MLSACNLSKQGTAIEDTIELPPIEIKPDIYSTYNPARKRKVDILHTMLKVKFDWDQAQLNGNARITLKPYFYPINEVVLDARGFDMHKVSQEALGQIQDLEFKYDGTQIVIDLQKEYTSTDTLVFNIKYTAKPNELVVEGSEAITDAKGLYFINPKGEEKDKPQQIWTQGETESSSCWFPTVDSPNERMSQELYITVDSSFISLSNGLLIYSTDNGDGTRTDYWKQDLQHAPYLTMMAIGKYAIIKDQWQDIEVSYYVEQEYEPYAMQIFGNTPEMLQFYSDLLGVVYPWDKYAQVVVRDYVSGAMENTGAVIFGEFMHKDSRELEDENNEDIIAHELFHHWFGDLVTCESWANLPLNESFATYGEYLWMEYKYGREKADYHLMMDLNSYLRTAERYQVDLIRFDYDDKEDMFDSHSYAKGGRVLHMLRKYVGDKAFFASLNLYLKDHQYTAVEIHDLRIAFEQVTGEDLNWFFNQWFMSSGHPILEISYNYDDSLKRQSVFVYQMQDIEYTPLYSLPLRIDIYQGDTVYSHDIRIDSIKQTFHFNVNEKPDLVNVDADKMLLGEKKDWKTKKEWTFQYFNGPLYLDRQEAINQLVSLNNDSLANTVLLSALSDKHWDIRLTAIENSITLVESHSDVLKDQLVSLARTDPKSLVRGKAIKSLALHFPLDSLHSTQEDRLLPLFKEALADNSYLVIGEALKGIASRNKDLAFTTIHNLDKVTQNKLLLDIADIFAKHGSEESNAYFTSTYPKLEKDEQYGFINIYISYLVNQNDSIINKGLVVLEDAATNHPDWWTRVSAIYGLTTIYTKYDQVMQGLAINNEAKKESNTDKALQEIQLQKEKITSLLTQIKEKEQDDTVLELWDRITPKL